ncbi:double-strand break repair protein AddB [Sphingobium subterraneum]|uniref:ATP-dependent helicase/nuclease subunit B n=1 Tax=Sphingobium subterraneum TaxID=627688 RepID=A0A841IYG4_9SPHN|nr:double-strand break repair protein AddB [Sphingobium subterraneum]MBB6123172.1 ATP-dependent helicase/nuclease subunit B [Sphingobium subterraneum]
MADRGGPAVYTIPAHRAFADALAIGLIAQHGKDPLALARGIILLPNNRAVRAISDAFVRHSGGGLLMPRLVPVGDVELDERLGNALDRIGDGTDIPPAIAPIERQMILARLVQQARQKVGRPVDAGEAMRLAQALGSTLDEMLVEQVDPGALRKIDLSGELSIHWQASLELLDIVLDQWPQELAARGRIDLADRRNRLLGHVARRWSDAPPSGFVVAAGMSTTAPAVCAIMATVARMPKGQVVLAELDQHMTSEEWDAIGPFDPHPDTGRAPRSHESHPQFTLKILLDRIGVARDEVALWRWGGGHDARAERSRNISNAMLVPSQTGKWRTLAAAERTLRGVRALEAATPAEEAQAIAIILREAIETPGRTAALVTPDRALATRVSAHLRRWGIDADDSAGQPLSLLPPGTLLLALARVMAERFAPVALLNLLKHPLVMAGEPRVAWLEQVRGLDLLLRGPRPAPDLAGIDALLAPQIDGDFDRRKDLRARVATWWPEARALLAPLEALGHDGQQPEAVFAVLREVSGALTNQRIWAGHQGHAAADLFADIEAAVHLGPRIFTIDALPDLLDRLLCHVAVRPPQGGHPRVAIYGLIEARLQQADVMILAGLNEGTWPGLPAPDPWLAPRIRQEIGLPGLERRIGLAAHDFASGLGAPRVTITRSRRSGNAPAVASRFWLRLQAIAGDQFRMATESLSLASEIDRRGEPRPAERPAPRPPVALRPRVVAVTDVDRLAADPYSFYARKVLGLSPLDAVDADPSAAWRGTAVHRILELWFREDGCDPERLKARALALLAQGTAHPLLRALWQPRLLAAIEWIAGEVAKDQAEGRRIALVEADGRIDIAGVTLKGKADRIDVFPDGSVGIVDYKTGKPPAARQVKAGYALQLGLLGLIAEQGGFPDLHGARRAGGFEYWSMGKKGDSFGYRELPTAEAGTDRKVATADLTRHAAAHFAAAAESWLTGDAPFTAVLNPELPSYGEYDQLMRLEEWYGRGQGNG